MRLIDADELRKKSTHARDIARYDGDLLVIGLGYLLDAPTHDADKLRVALEGLYNAVAKQRYAEGSELMDAWKAAGDVLGISETQTDKDKKWAERIHAEFTRPSITPIAALQELYKEIKDATEVARALRDVLNRTTAEVAWALYYDLDLSAEDTAKALKDGLDLSTVEVAWVLKDGLNLSAEEFARVLKDVMNLEAWEIAKALRDVLSLSDDEITWALFFEDGLDLSAPEIAQALRDGLNLTDEEVTAALKDAKIAPEQFHAEKALSEMQNDSMREPPPSYRTATELKAEKKGNQTGIRR